MPHFTPHFQSASSEDHDEQFDLDEQDDFSEEDGEQDYFAKKYDGEGEEFDEVDD